MNLIDNLIKVDNVQGGTIHQYINVANDGYMPFLISWQRHTNNGQSCLSFHTLQHMANKFGIVINWNNKTKEYYGQQDKSLFTKRKNT